MMMKLNEISIEITQQCPNHCIHCSSFSTWHTNMMMPWPKLREVIDDAVTLGAKTICLSGGEPFLHPNIIDIVKYIHEKGCSCFIYSSGIILSGASLFCRRFQLAISSSRFRSLTVVSECRQNQYFYNIIIDFVN